VRYGGGFSLKAYMCEDDVRVARQAEISRAANSVSYF
jgi:hypothetical protein